MIVYVVVFNPQGSMGGFNWFHKREDAKAFASQFEEELVLGVTEFSIGPNFTPDEITDEIDAQLPETEQRLGYDPARYGN